MLLVGCDDVLEVRSLEDDMKAQEEKELVRLLILVSDYLILESQNVKVNI